ncbi:MAG: ABC transporter permease [Candidatus Bathyarchaeia archaeon]
MLEIFTQEFLLKLLSTTVHMSAPILFAALGEVLAERSGVLNLGLEGVMLIGAFSGFWIAFSLNNLYLGIILSLIASALMGLFIAFFTVTLRKDQIVTGIGVWILGSGLSSLLFRVAFHSFESYPRLDVLKNIKIPILSEAPYIGKILFQQNILVYIAFLTVLACDFVLNKTTFGLKIRAIGENPKAAETLGVNVYKARYMTVILGSALAGLGGASLSIGSLGTFVDNLTAGRGFIAIAIVIFGRWKPYGVLLGALLFGTMDSLQISFQALGIVIPYQFLLMLPYVVTILALLMLIKKRVIAPAALCIPYEREV